MKHRLHPLLCTAFILITLLVVLTTFDIDNHVDAQVIGDPPTAIVTDEMPPLYIDYFVPYIVKEN